MNVAAATSAPRRGLRDWVVDTALVLAAALFAPLAAADQLEAATRPEPAWLFPADQVAAVLGCAGLWLRRRWPVGLALLLVALSTFSELVAGAMVVALFTVAVYRPPRTTAAVYALSVLAALVYVVLRPEPGVPPLLLFLLGVAIQGAAVGWGAVHPLPAPARAVAARPGRPGRDRGSAAGRAGSAAGGRVGPGRDAGGAARRGRRARPRPARPHRLPDRAGGPDQRPQARPRRPGGSPGGRPRPGTDRRGLQSGPRRRGHPHGRPGPDGGPAPTPDGPGQGLAGLAERVALANGRLEHGPTAAGGWRLAAWPA
jgi:hypothetical protein